MLPRLLFLVAGLLGMAGIILSASAAHGLDVHLSEHAIGWVETSGLFLLLTAPVIVLSASLPAVRYGRLPGIAGLLLAVGAFLFAGALAGLAFTGIKIFSTVAPIGGICLILGWAVLGGTAFFLKPQKGGP